MNNQTILNQVADYIENKFYVTIIKSRIAPTFYNYYMCNFETEGDARIEVEVYLYDNRKVIINDNDVIISYEPDFGILFEESTFA